MLDEEMPPAYKRSSCRWTAFYLSSDIIGVNKLSSPHLP